MNLKILIIAIFIPFYMQAQYKYPDTKKVDQTDTYHGISVADPYRWLEDDNADDTKAWVTEQNKTTQEFFDKISYLSPLTDRLNELYNYPKYSSPFRKGEYYYYYYNTGLQNQSVLYRTKGPKGKAEMVIDPNTLSADGTTKLAGFSLSKNGKYAAVYLSKGGSDWSTGKVMDMTTLKYLNVL